MMEKPFLKGLISGLTIAGLVYGVQQTLKRRRNKSKANDQKLQSNVHLDDNESKELMMEQLVRNYQFFGESSQKKIEDAYIMIFGVGGVGSHVLSCLARSGVGEIAIIDFDQVSLSSLNRHAFATREHVGCSKVEVFVKFLQAIVPNMKLKTFESYVTPENKPSFVIDCIDNIDAKTALVAYCVQNQIKIVSSCGAGMKADPTRIQIRDISQSSYDNLAKALRIRLKKLKIRDGVTVVFSNEISDKVLLPLKDHQVNKVDQYQTFKNYRVRIVPVMGAMPAMIAYSISSYVLCQLAEQPFKPQETDDVKQTTYNRLYQLVLALAKRIGIKSEDINIDMEDIYIIARETYEWKCLICGKFFKFYELVDKKSLGLELVRWDPDMPISLKNLVPMYGNCIQKHLSIRNSTDLKTHYDPQIMENKRTKDIIIDQILESKRVLFN